MNFESIQSQASIKNFLENSLKENRISHALLFSGKPGWGTLSTALWYAKKVLCDGKENCNAKVEKLVHPDLHFSIPTIKTEKTEALTKNYIKEFREMVVENPFSDINDWYSRLDDGKKQGLLTKQEIDEVMAALSLKSYEGGYKVMIIWYADKMKSEYANKLLKLLEEPPQKTLFILITDAHEKLLDTIKSRCVPLNFKPLEDVDVENYLREKTELSEQDLKNVTKHSFGDIHKAEELIEYQDHKTEFERMFVRWTRDSYAVKKDLRKLDSLIKQSEEIAQWNPEKQKNYIQFCIEVFRSGLMHNYQVDELSYSEVQEEDFVFENFAVFVHGSNIEAILEDLNQAYLYLERNANKKLLFTNLSLKLSRHIHKKAQAL